MSVRQSTNPIEFDRSRRFDNVSALTSGNAGQVIPITVAPMHRGDSCSGRIEVSLELAEQPKPLKNAVLARLQAWFVPRPALPHFSGLDEVTAAFHGKDISALGESTRTPVDYFKTTGTGSISGDAGSEFYTSLGIPLVASTEINNDYIDAYNLIYNFRLDAHSSKMTRANYRSENTDARNLKPAFWPRSAVHQFVADYESALVKGSLELDVTAGSIPVTGIATDFNASDGIVAETDNAPVTYTNYQHMAGTVVGGGTHDNLFIEDDGTNQPNIYAEMASQTIATSLADIDKARTTQAMAKAVAAMEGSDFSGFQAEDVIVSELMQGFQVPNELLQRPWLLDNKTLVFGMTERHATDSANLDDSSSTGFAQGSLSINVPRAEYGGIIMATAEIFPERLYERQADEYLYCTTPDDLPNAMRDILRTEPVDTVLNRRVDALHSTPGGTFGYEPMNNKWNREFTRLGGEFRQNVPGTPDTSARLAIWQPDVVDPVLTSDHWLCPDPMPQDVFSFPSAHIVHIHVNQRLTMTGITQFGDSLVEDNSEFATVLAEQT